MTKSVEGFITGLNRKKHPKIKIRYRPVGKANPKKYHLDLNFSNASISMPGNSVQEDIKDARMVVQFKIPATNFLECLYVDKPCIGINMNDNPTEYEKLFYNDLIELGVLHNSFEEMKNFINEIDLEDWHDRTLKIKNIKIL